MDSPEIVLRFLESVGRPNEAQFYLELFRAEAKERFATIAVDAHVAKHALDAVAFDLRFLAALGLVPVVALGLFEPGTAAEHAAGLVTRLERDGLHAAVRSGRGTGGAREATLDAAEIAELVHRGTIPIVTFSARGAEGVDERFTRLGALVSALHTRKLIFLHRRGPLRQGGAAVEVVNLATEYEALAASAELSGRQRALLVQTRRLLVELVPHRLVASIASPLDLLRELFTVKGAGTLFKRGEVIERRGGFAEVDLARLRALLQSSFGRPANDAFFARPVQHIYLEQDYRGAAILADTAHGAYLSKFAVGREAQGEGLGRDLWQRVAAEHPVVFWRARRGNPIGAWYTKLCDGLVRDAEWTVFWKGLPVDAVPAAVAWARAQPLDLAPPAGTP